MSARAETATLALDRVSLRFGAVDALREVSLTLESGRVTCLLGDNGAGKSSLVRVLSGVYPPTSGRLALDGQEIVLASPRDALGHGIATVHQDLALVPLLSVWRNFVLGTEPTRGRGLLRRLDVPAARAAAHDGLAALGLAIADLDRPVATLSGGERQSLAIARAIRSGPRVLLLDEPTAALGVKQAASVLGAIRRARERGIAVLLITHNPRDALAVGDRLVVLRQGAVEADAAAGTVGPDELAALMSGAEVPRAS